MKEKREILFPFGDEMRLRLRLRKMKLTVLLTFLVIATFGSGFSQVTLSLHFNQAKIQDVLGTIEKKTDYIFMYKDNIIDGSKPISVDFKDAKFEEVLRSICEQCNIDFEVRDRQIILKEKADIQLPSLPQQPQKKEISGTAKDTKGLPLPGVSVVVKGTTIGTVTDNDGKFSLSIPTDAQTLVFSFIGMKTQEVAIYGKSSINIIMLEEVIGLGEVVAIGYGTQSLASLTAAVSSIKSKDIAAIPTSNLSNVLQGRFSGAYFRSYTGTPGISSEIRVRAISSWNGGSPVYVIDDVVRDKTSFDALAPNEVAEITILKDAASAAIYGSRSSNGVILVTTKTGKSGKPSIQYSTSFGTERITSLPKMLPLAEGLKINQDLWGKISQEEADWVLKNNPNGDNYFNLAYTDPTTQNHNLSASGGNDFITYYIGGSFYDEKGFLPNVWYKKYNLRGNIKAKLTKDLSIGLNLSNSYGMRNRYNWTNDTGSEDLKSLWSQLLYQDLWNPGYIDGKPLGGTLLSNVVEVMKNGGYWRNKNQQVDALFNIEYKFPFIPGLTAKASYSRNFNNSFTKNYAHKTTSYTFKTTGANGRIYTNEILSSGLSTDPGTEYISNSYAKTDAYQLNGQVNYVHSFGLHNFNALAIYEQYEGFYNAFAASRNNFPLFPTDQFFAASLNATDWSNSASETEDGRLSYIGRLNYDYDGKYLFSSSIRRDGSIKFSPEQRWGWFPSVSAGWVLSRENFFQNTKSLSFIELLKLRLSYGSTGNDAIGGWQWQDQYNIVNGSYYIGNPGITAPRLSYGGIPNADITWEKSNSYNIGLDLNFLKHFTLTSEFWLRNTYDILGSRILALPYEFGGTLPAVNYGKVDSKGLEIELSYTNKVGNDFTYNLKGNFGLATTNVVFRDKAATAQPIDNPNGKTLSYLTGYQTKDILRTQADLDALPVTYTIFAAKPELGMMNFTDLSGVGGVPDGKIDSYDRIVLSNYNGSSSAPLQYGLLVDLAYKGITIDMMFAGQAGFDISANGIWGRQMETTQSRVWSYFTDIWSPENPNGSMPKLYQWTDARASGYIQNSSLNTFKGDFVRMKYLSVAYRIPSFISNKVGIKSASLVASGTNLFTLSKFKFYDPELTSFSSYPLMKTFSLGFTLDF